MSEQREQPRVRTLFSTATWTTGLLVGGFFVLVQIVKLVGAFHTSAQTGWRYLALGSVTIAAIIAIGGLIGAAASWRLRVARRTVSNAHPESYILIARRPTSIDSDAPTKLDPVSAEFYILELRPNDGASVYKIRGMKSRLIFQLGHVPPLYAFSRGTTFQGNCRLLKLMIPASNGEPPLALAFQPVRPALFWPAKKLPEVEIEMQLKRLGFQADDHAS